MARKLTRAQLLTRNECERVVGRWLDHQVRGVAAPRPAEDGYSGEVDADAVGVDGCELAYGAAAYRDWQDSLLPQDDPDATIRTDEELLRMRNLAPREHRTLAEVIEREHADDIAGLLCCGLIDRADLDAIRKPKRRAPRRQPKDLH